MSENDRDDKIRAKVLEKLHRKGFYQPRGVAVETAVSIAVATHNRGRAKELTREMAEDDSYPIIYRDWKESVYLEQDSESWVAASIRRHDDDAVPWDLE